MVRKSLYVAIPYILGFLISYWLYGTSGIYLAVGISVVVVAFLKLVLHYGFRETILCETTFLIGMLVYSNYALTTIDYLKSYDNQTITFTGKVSNVDDYTDASSYVLTGKLGDKNIKLSLYTTTLECSYGDIISLNATVNSIDSSYLFDSQQYYNSKGIYLEVGNIYSLEVTPNSNGYINLIRNLQSYRDSVINSFKLHMSKESSSLLVAILFGDKSDLAKGDKDSLIRSGLGSLIAVSGFHLAVLTSLLRLTFKALDKRDLAPPMVVKFLAYEIFMLVFITVVGFPISAVRTFIMLSISNVAKLVFRKPDTLTTLSTTAMLMLTFEPYLIGNISFLLSVVGVFGIGVLSPYLLEKLEPPKWSIGILSIAITTACTIPVCATTFDEVSILSPISNIVCVPLCEIALICGFVVFLLGGKSSLIVKGLLFLADISCKGINLVCGKLSKLAWGNVPTGYDILLYVLAICVVICIVSYAMFKDAKRLAITMLGSALIVFCSVLGVTHMENNILKVAYMGNSQYSVMVISYQGGVNIVDFSKSYKTSSYVQKYLKRSGYHSIDSLTFLRNAYQSIAMYDTSLKDYTCKVVNVPQGIVLRSDYTVLGNYPTEIDTTNAKLVYTYDGYTVTVYNNGKFEVLFNGVTESFTCDTNTILEYYSSGKFSAIQME